MLPMLANGLVIVGLFVMGFALRTVFRLLGQLPTGLLRRKWIVQSILVVIFLGGYLAYMIAFWNRASRTLDLIVPGVFFFGAIFVWMTFSLSLQTAVDIRRVTLLEQENITDPLIGVYNRRYIDRRLEEELARAKRYNLPLALLMIDIDHFKRVNDQFGHQTGDRVLRYLGDLLMSVVRTTDIVARYGGEELLVITPHTASNGARDLAERIRSSVETHELVLSSIPNQRTTVRITISIGVAGLTPHVETCEAFISTADQALYNAKKGGRNCVVLASDVGPRADLPIVKTNM